MTDKKTKQESKAYSRLKDSANKSGKSLTKHVSKGIQGTFKWMTSDHSRTSDRLTLTGLLQRINYQKARMDLQKRRSERGYQYIREFHITHAVVGTKRRVTDWVIDHGHFLMAMIWGFVHPILIAMFSFILRLVLIVIFNVIFFYFLYLILTKVVFRPSE